MKYLAPSLFLLAISTCSLAEDAPQWSGEGALGFTSTSGNSETETLTAKLGINYKNNKWGNEFAIDTVRTETTDTDTGESTETANRYTITDKVTYDINESWFAFVNGLYTEDEFSGFDNQYSITAGAGWKVINNDTTKFTIELGAGYKQDEFDSGETQDGAAGRFAEKFSHKFNENTSFNHSIVSEGNSDNVLTVMENAVNVKMSEKLSLKVSHQVKHNSDVTDASNYDRTTAATLVYGF
jgi:putative salt-induced outer membrane protein